MGDFDKIWREHCEDEQTLSEYALAMKNLADNHWTKNCEGEGRIEWCRRYDRLQIDLVAVKSDSSKPVGCACVTCLCHFHSEVWVAVLWFHFHSVCQEYFLDGGMKRMLEKDEKSAMLAMGLTAASVSAQPNSTIPRWAHTTVHPQNLLRIFNITAWNSKIVTFQEMKKG